MAHLVLTQYPVWSQASLKFPCTIGCLMSFFRKPETRFVVIDRGIGTQESLAPDTFETTFLSVCRHLFESFQKPESECWMNAFMEAEQRFPPHMAQHWHMRSRLL